MQKIFYNRKKCTNESVVEYFYGTMEMITNVRDESITNVRDESISSCQFLCLARYRVLDA